VLPCQASSVPCERIFSGSKQTATDRRARLGNTCFEELQITKNTWRGSIVDNAALNSAECEEISLVQYEEMLVADKEDNDWYQDEDYEPMLHVDYLL
jgi:hypothetical protein